MSNPNPTPIADPTLLERVADQTRHTYAALLGAAGGVQAILASLLGWMKDWKLAALIAAVGTLGVLAVLAVFAYRHKSTLREAARPNQMLWCGSLLAWVIGALAGAFWTTHIWYVVMVALALLGVGAAYLCYTTARPASTVVGKAHF